MICCSIVLILSISSFVSVFKRFFGSKFSIDFNCGLEFKDCKASDSFLPCTSNAFVRF